MSDAPRRSGAGSAGAYGDRSMLSRREVVTGGVAAAVLAACSSGGRTAKPPAASTGSTDSRTQASARGGPAQFIASGPAASGSVAFTFHTNGDPALCNKLFDDAKRLQVPLTFFVVGNWLHDQPAVAPRLLADSHELANHTYTHPSLGQLSASQVADEIVRCRDELAAATDGQARWFRPSGLDIPTQVILEEAGKAGYATVIGYDVDPLDYQDPGAAAVADRVRERIHPGAIVSLHTSHQGTVDAFADIVESVRAAGLRPVTVSDLLGGH